MSGGKLADQDELGTGRLGVGEHFDARRVVAGDIEARPIGGRRDGGMCLGRLALGRRRKMLLHLGFDQCSIEVTHRNDGHEVGPVPTLIVLPQALDRARSR